jgi:hypothetical protein
VRAGNTHDAPARRDVALAQHISRTGVSAVTRRTITIIITTTRRTVTRVAA